MKEISVEGCKVIGRGGQGVIYRLDEETIVKLYNPGYSLEAINRERESAKAALKLGIPTAISFGTVKCGESYGIIFELMNSGTLSAAMRAEPEKLPQYVKMYYDLYNELHSIHDTEGIYPKLKDCFHQQADRLGRWLSPDEVKAVHSIVDALKDEDSVLHGDFHPGNIMLHNGELLLIDIPDVKSGSQLYDLANVFRDMISCPQSTPHMCEISQGLTPEMCSQIGNMLFSMYCKSTDPEVIGGFMKQLGLVYGFFMTMFIGEENLHPEAEKAAPGIIDHLCRKIVLPNADTVKHLLQTL